MRSTESLRRAARPPLLLEQLETRVVPSFLAPLAFDTGLFPRSVAVGDVNGDGLPDLTMADYGDFYGNGQGVSVLLGNGDGSFQTARTVNAGANPSSLAVADVNGDGLPDLAVTDLSGVSVLLGNGDGTFQAPRSFEVGTSPRSVAVGDVNGDGFLDLAVADRDSDTVSVLLGNGDGSFQTAREFSAGSRPLSVILGDVNNDGLPDLAVADRDGNTVSVLLGNGDGTFQPARAFAAGTSPISVAVGDVNGDGLPDLIVSSGTVRVLLGNGDGTFQPALVSYIAGRGRVSVADLNGDGWPDLVTANFISNNVSVLLNAADDAALFALDAPAATTAGVPFDLTVAAFSATGLPAHGYRGTVAFASTDPAAVLPEPYAFGPKDGGRVLFSDGVTLNTPGTQRLYAYDLETFTVLGYAVIEVKGGSNPGGAPRGPAFLVGLWTAPARPLEWPRRSVTPAERTMTTTLPPPAVALPPAVPASVGAGRRGLVPRPIRDPLFANWDDLPEWRTWP